MLFLQTLIGKTALHLYVNKSVMILSNNYNDKKVKKQINDLLGNSYSFMDRLKLRGIGSKRLKVKSYSPGLNTMFGRGQGIKYTIIELRPKGIIIYIKNSLNEYVWLIPFHKLTLYKSTEYSIHGDGESMHFDLTDIFPSNQKFIDKLNKKRNSYLQQFELPPQ